ncbi:MAG: hypothetical protein LBU89_08200, partial [Fibromonadaceae bacterium]|nr:hypothetical protein [Fibromonadaceae bacterium]
MKKLISILFTALLSVAAFAQGLPSYTITKDGENFRAYRDGASINDPQPIENVIGLIRTNSNNNASIQFGNGTDVLNIGGMGISFGQGWNSVALSGAITSSNKETIRLESSLSLESSANIANTNADGSAIFSISSGSITITGGTISATGDAVSTGSGAVTVRGGTISSTEGAAVLSNAGQITITGGTLTSLMHEAAVSFEGTVALSGNPTINGTISAPNGIRVNELFDPDENKKYTLLLKQPTVGSVAVTNGAPFIGNFTLTNAGYILNAQGNNLVVAEAAPAPYEYVITGSGTEFTARRNGVVVGRENSTIYAVIDSIKTNAVGNDCTIQFGNGTDVLNLGWNRINFNNETNGRDWGLITLLGKVAGLDEYTIWINKVSVKSEADISGSDYGAAIENTGGNIHVIDGTISGYYSILNIDATGSLILSGNPTINGTISGFEPGKIRAADNFNPSENKKYILEFRDISVGDIAVDWGINFVNNFVLANEGYILEVFGDFIVVASATPPPYEYIITGYGNMFTATRGGGVIGRENNTIQAVIDSIRTNAGGNNCTIQFGANASVLNIGLANISFSGAWGTVTLKGRISSSDKYTIDISTGSTIKNEADISNTGGGVAIQNSGRATLVLSGNPTINGTIYGFAPERISVDDELFAPSEDKKYTLHFNPISAGMVTVTYGWRFVNNFELANKGYILEEHGDNLIVVSLAPPLMYSVTLIFGGGSPRVTSYEAGDTVKINAATPPTGQEFERWKINSRNRPVTLDSVNLNNPNLTFLIR